MSYAFPAFFAIPFSIFGGEVIPDAFDVFDRFSMKIYNINEVRVDRRTVGSIAVLEAAGGSEHPLDF